jgi:hypothetical protein
MPLMNGKSKHSFEHNVQIEKGNGKSKAQALAIAYEMRRRNAKKEADAGMPSDGASDMGPMESDSQPSPMNSRDALIKRLMERRKMAEGGMVDDVPELDKKKAQDFEHGATESGFQPRRWLQNIKEGLGMEHKDDVAHYYEGGEVESQDDEDQALDSQDFLTADEPEMDPKEARRHMITSMMQKLHLKHFGRE